MTAAVFQATYSDLKTVKSRGVCQVVLEAPLEQSGAILAILDGLPKPGNEVWVAVARLQPKASKPVAQYIAEQEQQPERAEALQQARERHNGRREFYLLPLSQQAALKCSDATFVQWLRRSYPASAVLEPDEVIRRICQVGSRRDLDTNKDAGVRWKALISRYVSDTQGVR